MGIKKIKIIKEEVITGPATPGEQEVKDPEEEITQPEDDYRPEEPETPAPVGV